MYTYICRKEDTLTGKGLEGWRDGGHQTASLQSACGCDKTTVSVQQGLWAWKWLCLHTWLAGSRHPGHLSLCHILCCSEEVEKEKCLISLLRNKDTVACLVSPRKRRFTHLIKVRHLQLLLCYTPCILPDNKDFQRELLSEEVRLFSPYQHLSLSLLRAKIQMPRSKIDNKS